MMLEGKLDTKLFFLKTVLYKCDGPEQAYCKAKEGITSLMNRYRNKEGDMVRVECHAIRDIQLLQDTWDDIVEQADDSSGYDLNDNFSVDERILGDVTTEKKSYPYS